MTGMIPRHRSDPSKGLFRWVETDEIIVEDWIWDIFGSLGRTWILISTKQAVCFFHPFWKCWSEKNPNYPRMAVWKMIRQVMIRQVMIDVMIDVMIFKDVSWWKGSKTFRLTGICAKKVFIKLQLEKWAMKASVPSQYIGLLQSLHKSVPEQSGEHFQLFSGSLVNSLPLQTNKKNPTRKRRLLKLNLPGINAKDFFFIVRDVEMCFGWSPCSNRSLRGVFLL